MKTSFLFYKILFLAFFISWDGFSQDSTKHLLLDMSVQLEIADAINAMYNFDFTTADRDYYYFRYRYPEHPLPYFLLGLSQWWRIVPDPEVEIYDRKFLDYMDSTIEKAEKMHEKDERNIEATFFLAAAYGFKGRLHSDRKHWRKATVAGNYAVKYMQLSKQLNDLSPEFLFGDALYNYYSIWVPENYPMLKPVVAMFPKGNKELGLKQLREVAMNSFYTRTEAQLFLMKIYANDESRPKDAFPIAEYLAQIFPNNPYFQRFYCRMLFTEGKLFDCEVCASTLLQRVDSSLFGYENVSGRYASFFLGYIYNFVKKDKNQALNYFLRTVDFSEKTDSKSAGYYLYALNYIARIYEEDNNLYKAAIYNQKILMTKEKDNPVYEQAQEFFKKNKKRKLKKLAPPKAEG